LYRARADLLLALKQLSPERRDAALSDLEAAIRYEAPGSPIVALDRTKQAALLHQAHRDEEALKSCDTALELSPRHAAAHRLRARILLDLNRYDDLIRSCDVALGSGKPSAELYELRGVAKDAREDFPGAVADYTLALAVQAGNARLLRRRGWSYLAQDASRPAATDFDEAIRLDPTNADAYSGRGFARACSGQHSEAVRDAEEAMRRGESSWRIAYNSARIYARAATAAGSEARKTGPDAVHLVSRYQDSALAHIRVALQRATLDNRSALLSELVATDPAFQPMRRRLRSIEGLRLAPQSPRRLSTN
jgi:tetratricopeptide (TPR) repeat protein